MGEPFFTAPIDEFGFSESSTLTEAEGPASLRGVWVGRDGEQMGDARPIDVEPGRSVETFERSRPSWRRTSAAIRVDAPPFELGEAERLQIFAGDQLVTDVAVSSMSYFESLGEPRLTERFGDARADRELRVFAERFQDFQTFNAAVGAFHRHLTTLQVFQDDKVRSRLGVRGYFWPSDPTVGRFNTRDPETRLFHGDFSSAWRLLYRYLQVDLPSVVLINSTMGGGAGGSKANGATPGHVAWASIAEIADYPWADVALHELGHAMGLADEYVSDDGLDYSQYVFDGQPNISPSSDRPTISWKDQLTTAKTGNGVDKVTGIPTAHRSSVVGVFKGAFYRNHWFRPSPDCLMQKLNFDFCPVCTRTLQRKLARLK